MRTAGTILVLAVLVFALPAQGQAVLGFGIRQVEVLTDSTKEPIPMPSFNYPTEARNGPNGRYLVFLGRTEDGKYWCPGGVVLCFVDTYTPRGGTPNAPIVLMAKAYDPIWSGTGHFFAFRASRGGPEYYPISLYIYRVRQDRNGGPGKPELWQRIDYDYDYYAWSPSPMEDRLLFDAVEGPREKRSPRALFIYEAGRRHLRIVDRAPWLQDPTTREWVPPYIPGYSWSPDGKYLVYPLVTEAMGDGQPLDADLWIASADGSKRQQLTFTPKVLEAWPKWVLKDRIDMLRIIFSTEPPKTEKVRLRLTTPRAVLLLDRDTATLGDAIQPLSEPVPPKFPAQPVLARRPAASQNIRPLNHWVPTECYTWWSQNPNLPCTVWVGLDAGHCGVGDPGAIGLNGNTEINESDLNLGVQNRLIYRLGGYSSVPTRFSEGPGEYCWTGGAWWQRGEILTGVRPAHDGNRFSARRAVSIHHNSLGKSATTAQSQFGTYAMIYSQSNAAPWGQRIMDCVVIGCPDPYYQGANFSTFAPLAGCNQALPPVRRLTQSDRGGMLLWYLWSSNRAAAMVELTVLNHQCQWEGVTTGPPTGVTQVDADYVDVAATAIALAYQSCEGYTWTCGTP